MDGSAFDRLTRSLSRSPSRRGAVRVLAGSALGGLVTLEALPGEATQKKKVTLCHSGQTITVSKKAKKKHLKHGDTLGACPTAPAPPCVPEAQATTCAGARCGTARINNCGQAVACNCPRGQECLLNGTCARPCIFGGSECVGCGGDVGCSKPSTEGVAHCSAATGCAVYQTCDGTAECPQGTHCQSCGTGFGTHCVPLSPCTGNCGGADACQGTPGTCPGAGQCFQPLGGGPTRCGVSAGPETCGCTSHQTCEANHGTGAFCAQVTGGACGCPGTSTTFCATTP